MAAPVFNLSGIHRILWDHGNGNKMRVSFADSEGRLLRQALILGGFQTGSRYLQGGIYDSCDQVQVFDHNVDGAQLEFGRYVVRFLRRGETVGEHVADSLERAG